MSKEMIDKEIDYQIAKTTLLTLKAKGALTEKQFDVMKAKLIEYYGPFIESLRGYQEWEEK